MLRLVHTDCPRPQTRTRIVVFNASQPDRHDCLDRRSAAALERVKWMHSVCGQLMLVEAL